MIISITSMHLFFSYLIIGLLSSIIMIISTKDKHFNLLEIIIIILSKSIIWGIIWIFLTIDLIGFRDKINKNFKNITGIILYWLLGVFYILTIIYYYNYIY